MRVTKVVLVALGVVVVVFGGLIALSPARHLVADYPPQLAERIAESRSSAPPAPVMDLTDVSQLQAAFNAGDGSPRLIMLVSPT